MADVNQIEHELREFLAKEDHIAESEKLSYLMAIINKHFALDKISHIMTYSDLDHIIGEAKRNFVNTSLPVKVSNKELHSTEVNYLLVLQSFIGYLNKHKLLKKLIKPDYRS